MARTVHMDMDEILPLRRIYVGNMMGITDESFPLQ